MTLTILNVAYPLAPVSLDAVGGAEQILAALDKALVEAGHGSIVIACERSRVARHLFDGPAGPGEPAGLGRAAEGGDRRQVVELAERRGVAHRAAQAAGQVALWGPQNTIIASSAVVLVLGVLAVTLLKPVTRLA